MIKFYSITLFSLVACRSNLCPRNKALVDEFKQKTNLIKFEEGKNVEMLVDDYRTAIFLLSDVTGISTRVEYNSTFGYRKKQYNKEDMMAWEKWIKKINVNFQNII